MDLNQRTIASFSKPYLHVELIKNVQDYQIDKRAIIINAGECDAIINKEKLLPKKSSIYANTTIQNAELIILVSQNNESTIEKTFPYSDEIINDWQHVYEIFPLESLKKTNLWRSQKQKIDSMEINLWFAKAGTHCGIHNEHDFKELHTQIWGLGNMQKFQQRNYETLYQDVYMSPGQTHDPFYDQNGLYPWHQYYAHTDCIWLALEF